LDDDGVTSTALLVSARASGGGESEDLAAHHALSWMSAAVAPARRAVLG
jgi:hypothetical protein